MSKNVFKIQKIGMIVYFIVLVFASLYKPDIYGLYIIIPNIFLLPFIIYQLVKITQILLILFRTRNPSRNLIVLILVEIFVSLSGFGIFLFSPILFVFNLIVIWRHKTYLS
jgi:hypothetical protein